MFLFIILIWILRIEPNKEDYQKLGKKIELNKLRLSKYQTLSITLISLGGGVFLAGQTSGDTFGTNTWIGILAVVIGVAILKFHVDTRYKILEDYYEKHEEEKIK